MHESRPFHLVNAVIAASSNICVGSSRQSIQCYVTCSDRFLEMQVNRKSFGCFTAKIAK